MSCTPPGQNLVQLGFAHNSELQVFSHFRYQFGLPGIA
jgi:hypothetical protein